MNKKHKSNISEFIFDDYIFNRDLSDSNDVLKQLDLLVDNDLAVKISGSEDISYAMVSRYKIASKFMCKYNKDLKKLRRKPMRAEYGADFKFADDNKELSALSKWGLEFGTHYAILGDDEHDDYAVLRVYPADKDDDYLFGYDLYFIGYRCLKWRDKFLKQVEHYDAVKKEIKNQRIIYCGDRNDMKEVRFKSFDQVIFRQKPEILKYIDNWITNIPQYYAYGITPKLSILLYGKPGTGKSTFYQALADHMNVDVVCSLMPGYFSDSKDSGSSQRGRRAPGTIVAIDDIDCVGKSREDNDDPANTHTIGNLLSYLDNPDTFYYEAKDGVRYPIAVVVATTNYYDKLDDAVKRYGRFDLKIEMHDFNKKEAEEMCSLYGLQLNQVYKEKIGDNFTISPAYLQALCLENIDVKLKKAGKKHHD